jgi:uncharacterized membrane protein YhaH (DUF805 family)
MQWFTDVITKRYAQFSGRARRKEFWMYFLFWFIVLVVAGILDKVLGLDYGDPDAKFGRTGWISTILFLAMAIPSIAVSVRRMHDKDRTGWWVLIWLIPCIGWIWFIIWQAQDGTPGDNRFGPDPKAAERGGFGAPGGAEPGGYPTA